MGFFSGLCSAVSSALAGAASSLIKMAGPLLGPVGQMIQIVSILMDVLKPGEKIEEIGAKAMQADSKKPEEFDNNAEYIEYLRSEVKLDQVKFDKAGEVEKAARTAVGASIVAKAIEEKKGFDIPMETWVAMAKLNMTDKAKEIDTLLETFKDGKLEDFAKYVDGKLDIKKEGEVGDTLVEMYKELEPNSSIEDIETKVMKMEVQEK